MMASAVTSNAKRSHYWVGDNSGEFADPRGLSAGEMQWTSFKAHPLAEKVPP
jgi:hypothetical protein